MTEKIKGAISEIENMRKFNYTLAPNEVFDLAINSLKAWEEVLQEVERQQKNGYWAIRLDELTEFIKQKLAEIEGG